MGLPVTAGTVPTETPVAAVGGTEPGRGSGRGMVEVGGATVVSLGMFV